jgi:Zn ribbon nucleic-acid-binding protein
MTDRLHVEITNDDVPYVVGECSACHRGENTLIVYHQMLHPNVRERKSRNNIVFMQCVACGSKFKSTTKDLIGDGKL